MCLSVVLVLVGALALELPFQQIFEDGSDHDLSSVDTAAELEGCS